MSNTFHSRESIEIHEFSVMEAVIDRIVRVLRTSTDNETHIAPGACCRGTLTCKRVARALARRG